MSQQQTRATFKVDQGIFQSFAAACSRARCSRTAAIVAIMRAIADGEVTLEGAKISKAETVRRLAAEHIARLDEHRRKIGPALE